MIVFLSYMASNDSYNFERKKSAKCVRTSRNLKKQ